MVTTKSCKEIISKSKTQENYIVLDLLNEMFNKTKDIDTYLFYTLLLRTNYTKPITLNNTKNNSKPISV